MDDPNINSSINNPVNNQENSSISPDLIILDENNKSLPTIDSKEESKDVISKESTYNVNVKHYQDSELQKSQISVSELPNIFESNKGSLDTGSEKFVKSQEKEILDVTEHLMEVEDCTMHVEDIPKLVLENIDDEDEEPLVLTVEDAQNHIVNEVKEFMKDAKTNHLLFLQNQILDLHKKIDEKNEQFNQLSKVFEVLYRDQIKFLRHIKAMSKAETKTVEVSVDLPWLPEAMSNLVNAESSNQENAPSAGNAVSGNNNSLLQKETTNNASGSIECIDLTDDDTTNAQMNQNINNSASTSNNLNPSMATYSKVLQHPAPLPPLPMSGVSLLIPPKPQLKIAHDAKNKGITLQWSVPGLMKDMKLRCYEIFAYQEKLTEPITSDLWKKIGSVEPMPLPMTCTLTHFLEGFVYHFTVRIVAGNGKYGMCSEPESILFPSEKKMN